MGNVKNSVIRSKNLIKPTKEVRGSSYDNLIRSKNLIKDTQEVSISTPKVSRKGRVYMTDEERVLANKASSKKSNDVRKRVSKERKEELQKLQEEVENNFYDVVVGGILDTDLYFWVNETFPASLKRVNDTKFPKDYLEDVRDTGSILVLRKNNEKKGYNNHIDIVYQRNKFRLSQRDSVAEAFSKALGDLDRALEACEEDESNIRRATKLGNKYKIEQLKRTARLNKKFLKTREKACRVFLELIISVEAVVYGKKITNRVILNDEESLERVRQLVLQVNELLENHKSLNPLIKELKSSY